MNKKALIILVLLTIISAPISLYAKNKKNGNPQIVFAEYNHDFGNVPENGGLVSHTFTFTNTGNDNLIIIDATATCGCTRPEYPKNPIAPGKQGKVKVTYNPAGRPGAIDRTVTVRTNGSPKKVRLKINGNVVPKQPKQ